MSKKAKVFLFCACAAVLTAVAVFFGVFFGFVKKQKYDAAHFGIETYRSATDKDGDGIDDQTDILASVKAYLETKPRYKSAYYASGWPDDGFGVCTDVVAQGLLGAGYDLRELVDADRRTNPEGYEANEKPDKNIDFRRVRNLLPYFSHTAISLTVDPSKIGEWQPGDVVVWAGHVGVISEHRNYKGVPFVYHHANERQTEYEEDVLESFGEILGHFRIT